MKKILAIFTAVIYLAITSGLALQIHYCMGREIDSSLQYAGGETHKCSKCGMENAKNKCCHDEVKFLKLQSDQQQVSHDYQCQPPAAPEQEFDTPGPLLLISANTGSFSNHSPPEPGDPSLCVLNCVFRL